MRFVAAASAWAEYNDTKIWHAFVTYVTRYNRMQLNINNALQPLSDTHFSRCCYCCCCWWWGDEKLLVFAFIDSLLTRRMPLKSDGIHIKQMDETNCRDELNGLIIVDHFVNLVNRLKLFSKERQKLLFKRKVSILNLLYGCNNSLYSNV